MKSRRTLSFLLAMVLAMSMFVTTSCKAATPEARPTESSAVTTEVSPATTTDVSPATTTEESPAANTATTSKDEEETKAAESANIEPVTTLYGRRKIDKNAAMAFYQMAETFREDPGSFLIIKDCTTTVPEVPVTDDPMSYIEEVDDEKTNLALDIMALVGDDAIDNEMGEEVDVAVWEPFVNEFGFIIRYPKGKEDITGHEPNLFHLRYVGSPELAMDISKAGSLEDYLKQLGQ